MYQFVHSLHICMYYLSKVVCVCGRRGIACVLLWWHYPHSKDLFNCKALFVLYAYYGINSPLTHKQELLVFNRVCLWKLFSNVCKIQNRYCEKSGLWLTLKNKSSIDITRIASTFCIAHLYVVHAKFLILADHGVVELL